MITPTSIAFIRRRAHLLRSYHITLPLKTEPKKFVPKDWKIVDISPGGVDRLFFNKKTGEGTWYTPEGMTAEEIFAIPGAKRRHWRSVEHVGEYIEEMAKQKAKSGGHDYDSDT